VDPTTRAAPSDIDAAVHAVFMSAAGVLTNHDHSNARVRDRCVQLHMHSTRPQLGARATGGAATASDACQRLTCMCTRVSGARLEPHPFVRVRATGRHVVIFHVVLARPVLHRRALRRLRVQDAVRVHRRHKAALVLQAHGASQRVTRARDAVSNVCSQPALRSRPLACRGSRVYMYICVAT
jgi:hypothetical protein